MENSNNGRKEDIEFFYKLCTRELEKAKHNVETYMKKVDEMYGHISNAVNDDTRNNSLFLMAYEEALTNLTNLFQLIRNFNVQCELKPLHYDNILKTGSYVKERFTYPKPNLSKFGINYEGTCVVTYIKDKKNKLIYINEIENPEHIKCISILKNYFLQSPKSYNYVPQEGEVFGLYFQGYFLRAVRENGSFNSENNNDGDQCASRNALLIDIGEVIKITPDMNIFILPHECIKVPAQAILCKLEMVNCNNVDMEMNLSNMLYVKHKFVVLSKDESVLNVNMLGNTNPFLDIYTDDEIACSSTTSYQPNIMNPFRQYFFGVNDHLNDIDSENFFVDNTDNAVTNYNPSLITSSTVNRSGLNSSLEDSVMQKKFQYLTDNYNTIQSTCDASTTTANNPIQSSIQQNDLNLTEKPYSSKLLLPTCDNNINYNESNNLLLLQLNQKLASSSAASSLPTSLLSKPSSSSSSEFASKRSNLNEFYNSIINYNSKDSNYLDTLDSDMQQRCKISERGQLSNDELVNDRTSNNHYCEKIVNQYSNSSILDLHSDEEKNKICKPVRNIKNKLSLPDVDEKITLVPTFIVDIGMFFAHQYSHESRYCVTLAELIRKMNEPDVIRSYTEINRPLEHFELVIAMFSDGYWYRARVIRILDDGSVKVFYLDYGNSDLVSKEQIRKWDSRFEVLPFQAIQCKISGIRAKQFSIDAREHMKKMILDKFLRAKVIRNFNNIIEVKLTDTLGVDVAEQLVLMGYASKI